MASSFVDLDDQVSFSAELLAQISHALGCRELNVILKKSWGSAPSQLSPTQHRVQIRQGLADHLRTHLDPASSLPEWRWESDLERLPEIGVQDFSFSISHARLCGGFAISRPRTAAGSLGFDLETTDRLSEPIIARISSLAERQQAPDARLLWVAKEATFKARRGPGQPAVITDITVHDWTNVGTWGAYTVYTFQALGAHGMGTVLLPLDRRNHEIFGFFYENGRAA